MINLTFPGLTSESNFTLASGDFHSPGFLNMENKKRQKKLLRLMRNACRLNYLNECASDNNIIFTRIKILFICINYIFPSIIIHSPAWRVT